MSSNQIAVINLQLVRQVVATAVPYHKYFLPTHQADNTQVWSFSAV